MILPKSQIRLPIIWYSQSPSVSLHGFHSAGSFLAVQGEMQLHAQKHHSTSKIMFKSLGNELNNNKIYLFSHHRRYRVEALLGSPLESCDCMDNTALGINGQCTIGFRFYPCHNLFISCNFCRFSSTAWLAATLNPCFLDFQPVGPRVVVIFSNFLSERRKTYVSYFEK